MSSGPYRVNVCRTLINDLGYFVAGRYSMEAGSKSPRVDLTVQSARSKDY